MGTPCDSAARCAGRAAAAPALETRDIAQRAAQPAVPPIPNGPPGRGAVLLRLPISEEWLVSGEYGSPEWQEEVRKGWEEDREKQRQHGDRYGNDVGSTAWNRKRSGGTLVALGTGGLVGAATAPDPLEFWWLAVLSVGAIVLGLRIWRKARRDYGGPWFE